MSRAELARLGIAALLMQRAGALRLVADIDEALATKHAREQAEDRYTSLDLPKHTTLRTFREAVKASGLGTKDGQVWSIAKSDWHALRRGRKVTQRDAVTEDAPIANDNAAADSMLAAAGMRATRVATNSQRGG